MSYDLLFAPKGTAPARVDFCDWFARRPHYADPSSQAFYENDDTGVYFSFELHEATEPVLSDDEGGGNTIQTGGPAAWAAFNMNYCRPHFFALEAAPEVETFAQQFDLSVHDPQVDGMGDGPFSREGFIRSWNSGNRFGCSAILNQPDMPAPLTLPTAVLERIWEWNHSRHDRQEELGETAFVPIVLFHNVDGAVQTVCIWPPDTPIVLPRTDVVIVGRKTLAPRRWWGTRREDECIVRWRQIASVIETYPRSDAPIEHFMLCDTVPRDDVARMIRGLTTAVPTLQGVSADNVLNRELVAEVRASEAGDCG